MDLLLSVVSDPDGANMLKHTKLFTREGGSVGRADSNDWVLPDPQRVVSSRHAEIIFAENRYFLVDQGTNGTFHNQSPEPIGKGNRVPLEDGDSISLGDYQLTVSVRRPAADPGIPQGLGGADFLDQSDRTTFSPAAAAKMQSAKEAQELDSWLEPGANGQSNQSGEWGYLVQSGNAADSGGSLNGLLGEEAVTDPLQVLNHSGSDGRPDLLGGFGATPAPAGQWGGDDDWWKDGSEQDHAPAPNHAMQFSTEQVPSPAAPAPSVTAAPPADPFAQASAPPVPPLSTPSHPPVQPVPPGGNPAVSAPVGDNPFAESFSAVAENQVEGAPGFSAPESPSSIPAAPVSNTSVPPQIPSQAPTAQTPVGGAFAGASQHFTPPPVNPGVESVSQPSVQASKPVAPARATAGVSSGSMAPALAQQLGLNLSPEQLAQLDEQTAAIVEESVSRLIDLLRARTSIKNELRVQRTMIQTEANNPLKFSATASDALGAMFAGTGAFMTPVEAVRDSFDDLSDHQVAVLSGMRAGYEAMLRYFSPENIAQRGGAQNGVFSSKNARNWENFVDSYRKMVSDPDTCYRRLFGEEFAATYESQLSELKNARNLNGSNRR